MIYEVLVNKYDHWAYVETLCLSDAEKEFPPVLGWVVVPVNVVKLVDAVTKARQEFRHYPKPYH